VKMDRGKLRQRLLPALERARARERPFKAAIIVLTFLALGGLLAGTPMGRFGSLTLVRRMKWAALRSLGLEPSRAEIDAGLRARRQRDIERTRETYRVYFEHDAAEGLRGILRAAQMAPDDVLLRWANIDWTIILSPRVFEADDRGRSYRMRPRVRSFWLQDHTLTRGLTSFFFLPDTPEVGAAIAAAGAPIMPESYQTTNSWGCRGPEPDCAAPVRILVLGDSFMQGLFIGDEQTPAENLERHLAACLKQRASVLNTGHIGYSPEQYYFTLREYFERFRPHAVVLSVCPNDFGNALAVLAGKGDWSEAKYWLDEIRQFCRTRGTPCLLVAAPLEIQLLSRQVGGSYPGKVTDLWEENRFFFLELTDAFIAEHLRLMAEGIRAGRRPATSPLFNGHLHDEHFSPLGAALWAGEVGRRLIELFDFMGTMQPLRPRGDPARRVAPEQGLPSNGPECYDKSSDRRDSEVNEAPDRERTGTHR
jgi:hypothetical protein